MKASDEIYSSRYVCCVCVLNKYFIETYFIETCTDTQMKALDEIFLLTHIDAYIVETFLLNTYFIGKDGSIRRMH